VIAFKSPLPPTIRQAGFGGVDKYHNLKSFSNGDLLINLSLKSDILLKQLQIQEKSYDTLYYLAEVKQDSLLSVPGVIPISPSGYFRISDPFGWRMHPIYHRLIKHTGIDFAGPVGSPIYAPGNGKVENIRITKTGYGKRLLIDHGYGFKTLYGHLSKIYVKEGDIVNRGQIIGAIGNTGTSTGSHLHYEVIYHNQKINPKGYFQNDLSNDEYMQMVQVLGK
jgi:murein DD-endopeptidase MepM/ murein hydrolase activator NlpD